MVDIRINETIQPGAVRKPHLPGDESVYLFLEFTKTLYNCKASRIFDGQAQDLPLHLIHCVGFRYRST